MKNFTNVKIKAFLAILLSINLIMQPVSITFYLINQIDASNILQHIMVGFYLSFSLSLLITDYIFKTIFYKMLKGKVISNNTSRWLLLYNGLLLGTLVFTWASFFAIQNHIIIYPLITIILCLIYVSNQTYIISNGFLFCGFTVIPLDTIRWYKVEKKRLPAVLLIKYSGNRSFKTTNSMRCLQELTAYFATHKISEKVS